MAKPTWQIQRELDAAIAREAFYSNPNRPLKTTRDAQPRQQVVYLPLFYKVGSTYPALKLQSSTAAITYFGLAALGLANSATELAEAGIAPRNFKPSLMKAMLGDATPTVRRAFGGTGRRYIDYSANTTGDAQAHYQAPISCGDATPSIDDLEVKVAGIRTAKAAGLGAYGRLWLELERFNKVVA